MSIAERKLLWPNLLNTRELGGFCYRTEKVFGNVKE